MVERISRRKFGARAALAVGAVAAAGAVQPQSEGAKAEDSVALVDKVLGRPLGADLRAHAGPAVKEVVDMGAARRMHKLPDGTEPCFVFVPVGVGEKP
jgi:hypothetical protein